MSRLTTIKWSHLGATFVFAFAVIAAQFSGVLAQTASAATLTWTGAGGDNRFSTAANWSSNSVPVGGDSIVFNSYTGEPDEGVSNGRTLDNDTNVIFGGVYIDGSGVDLGEYGNRNMYTVNTIQLTDGTSIVSVNKDTFAVRFNSVIFQGDGYVSDTDVGSVTANTVTVSGSGVGISGGSAEELIVQSGTMLQSATDADGTFKLRDFGTIKLDNGSELLICTGARNTSAHVPNNLTIGGGSGAAPVITASPCMGAPGMVIKEGFTSFSGQIQLQSNAVFRGINTSVSMNSTLQSNGYTFTLDISGNSYLLGSGTTGSVILGSDATFAPGNSPGLLTVSGLIASGTFEVEIDGPDAGTSYDQVRVNGAVDVTDATLEVLLGDSYEPMAGTSFIIIDNDASDSIAGIFTGLAEGATFTVDGTTFQITYEGGDGNDVVLTVVDGTTAPGTPNTGALHVVMANPAILALVGVIAAAGILFALRRARQ